MEENPYEAPGKSSGSPAKVTTGRRISVMFIVPCVVIGGLEFCAAASDMAVIIFSEMPVDLAQTGLSLVTGTAWSVTAWAIWTNRRRAVIKALCADVVAAGLWYI